MVFKSADNFGKKDINLHKKHTNSVWINNLNANKTYKNYKVIEENIRILSILLDYGKPSKQRFRINKKKGSNLIKCLQFL